MMAGVRKQFHSHSSLLPKSNLKVSKSLDSLLECSRKIVKSTGLIFFVWWLDSDIGLLESDLERYLEDYFYGLAKEIASHKKLEPSGAIYNVSLDSMGPTKFSGISVISNEATGVEIPSLKLRIEQLYCKPQKRLAVLFELSPKEYLHKNWEALSSLKSKFKCGV